VNVFTILSPALMQGTSQKLLWTPVPLTHPVNSGGCTTVPAPRLALGRARRGRARLLPSVLSCVPQLVVYRNLCRFCLIFPSPGTPGEGWVRALGRVGRSSSLGATVRVRRVPVRLARRLALPVGHAVAAPNSQPRSCTQLWQIA
jgi:hypothetical protein